jgi:hypothetical protein
MGMADDWLSIPQIAARSGVSDNTVRRYISRFPAYFAGKAFDGVTKYPSDTAVLVARISALYHTGRGRNDVEQALAEEFQATHEPMPDSPATTQPPAPAALMERMVEALEALTDQKHQLETLARENVALRERVTHLEALVKGPTIEAARSPQDAPEPENPPEGHAENKTAKEAPFWRSWLKFFGGGDRGE